jgi:hypothetical protein
MISPSLLPATCAGARSPAVCLNGIWPFEDAASIVVFPCG